jgi:hypothetical protein
LFVCLFNSYFFVWYFFLSNQKKESDHWWVTVYENGAQIPGPGRKAIMKLFWKVYDSFLFFVINYFP